MPLILFALFLAVPLIEIALFIVIGDKIGLWPTLGLVVLTAAIGTALIRLQSLAVIRQAREKADRGEPPIAEMGHGVGLILAGALLITPGFFTDALGAALLVPAFRRWLGTVIASYAASRGGAAQAWRNGPRQRDDVIDGDYQDITGEAPPPGKPGRSPRLPDGERRRDGEEDKGTGDPGSPWKRP